MHIRQERGIQPAQYSIKKLKSLVVNMAEFTPQTPKTSSINRLMYKESMPPLGSSRVMISVPFGQPPASYGRMSLSRYHCAFSSQRRL
jgi:hypothetical protein